MRRICVMACCAAALVIPAAAHGDGGPVPAMQGGSGASTPDGRVSYVAVDVPHGTLVERLHRDSIHGARLLPGRLGIQGVSYDGLGTGLSADGHTLVLAHMTNTGFPRRTRLLMLDADRLRLRPPEITLPGFFIVDAISPHGRWLYLLHYTSDRNLLRYEVRAYDLRTRRLLPKPIVDPREPDEAMRGTAVTRVTSADGRWAYTLYQRPEGAPFIHALDTSSRTAACIDLDDLKDMDASTLRLHPRDSGRTLSVNSNAGPQLLLNTRTFALRRPPIHKPPARRSARGAVADTGNGTSWAAPAGVAAAAAAALALVGLIRRRRRPVEPVKTNRTARMR